MHHGHKVSDRHSRDGENLPVWHACIVADKASSGELDRQAEPGRVCAVTYSGIRISDDVDALKG